MALATLGRIEGFPWGWAHGSPALQAGLRVPGSGMVKAKGMWRPSSQLHASVLSTVSLLLRIMNVLVS